MNFIHHLTCRISIFNFISPAIYMSFSLIWRIFVKEEKITKNYLIRVLSGGFGILLGSILGSI